MTAGGPLPDAAPPAFSFPVRVYWEDTDAGGVVYHAQDLAFMERARSEWLRALGVDQGELRAREDLVFVVADLQATFRAPARLDDQLAVSVRLLQCRGASMLLAQRIERAGDVLVKGRVKVAAVGASDFRPKPIPGPLRARLTSTMEQG